MQQKGDKNERVCLWCRLMQTVKLPVNKITHMDQIHRVDRIFLDPFLAWN